MRSSPLKGFLGQPSRGLGVKSPLGLAIGLMARAPSMTGKTRLAAQLSAERLHSLRQAPLVDTLTTVASIAAADSVVFVPPAAALQEVAAPSPRSVPLAP